jgi:hypothetical protein
MTLTLSSPLDPGGPKAATGSLKFRGLDRGRVRGCSNLCSSAPFTSLYRGRVRGCSNLCSSAPFTSLYRGRVWSPTQPDKGGDGRGEAEISALIYYRTPLSESRQRVNPPTGQSTSRRRERPSSGDSPRRKVVAPTTSRRRNAEASVGDEHRMTPSLRSPGCERARYGGSGGASLRSPWTSGAARTDGRLGSDWLVWPLVEVWCLSRPTGRGSGRRRRGTAVPELHFSVFSARFLERRRRPGGVRGCTCDRPQNAAFLYYDTVCSNTSPKP